MTAGPLAGLRVIDLGHSWAAPFAAMVLRDLGADVIKVESSTRIDILRWSGAFVDGIRHHDRSGFYIACNRGKRSLALNLKTDEAREILLELVEGADVLLENFSPAVMPRLGLGKDVLLARNPRLIMISMSGYGATGPEREYISYGDHLMHASGLAALIGHPDDEHTRIATFYGDPVAGFFASLRIVASLVAGRHGEHHEFAQLEGLLAVIPTPLMRASQGAPLERVPDKSPRRAPHGFFRCAGADTWIALSVRTDAEWAALRGLIDGLPVAPSLAERKAGEAAIDATLAAWTATRSPWDVTVALQGIGVPAFPVHSGDGLLKDAHLADRGFFRWVERPLTGGTPLPGVAFRVAGDGAAVRGYSPLLGEHSEEILTGELGLTAERVAELVAREVIR